MNREEWLAHATDELKAVIKDRTGLGVPDVHVSVGWPSRGGTSLKKRVIGQCWNRAASSDDVAHIFISPVLDDEFDVLAVLVHELIHAMHPEAGHRGDFVSTAKAVGLVKPWTATSAGEDLEPVITRILKDMVQYPHAALDPTLATKARKPQSTRQLKVVASEECGCGYTLRTTAKWLEVGLPKCPHDVEMERAD